MKSRVYVVTIVWKETMIETRIPVSSLMVDGKDKIMCVCCIHKHDNVHVTNTVIIDFVIGAMELWQPKFLISEKQTMIL